MSGGGGGISRRLLTCITPVSLLSSYRFGPVRSIGCRNRLRSWPAKPGIPREFYRRLDAGGEK